MPLLATLKRNLEDQGWFRLEDDDVKQFASHIRGPYSVHFHSSMIDWEIDIGDE